jgi:putative redox protein
MQSTTRMLEDEVYEASNESGQTVTIDMRLAALKKNQSPVELLLSALSSCAAVDVVAILKKRKKTIRSFRVEADGTRREDPPRYFTKIKLTFIVHSPDVTEEELEKAAHLSVDKYCSVAGSLRSEITLRAKVIRD